MSTTDVLKSQVAPAAEQTAVVQQVKAATVIDVVRARYSSNALANISAVIVVLFFAATMVAQFVGGAKLFEAVTGYSYMVGLVLFGAAVILFTTIGGFRGVAFTDALCGIIMLVGIGVLAAGILTAGGGYGNIMETIKANHPAMLEPFSGGGMPATLYFTQWLLVGVFTFVLPQSMVRCMGFKDTKALHGAMITGTVIIGLMMIGVTALGVLSAGVLTGSLADYGSSVDNIIPRAIAQTLPSWAAGVAIIGPIAASISTVSSLLIASSSAIIKDVYLHCIMDGRDTDPHSGKGFLADLQAKLDELGIGKIASVSGRYYAMDRDNNWDREEKAYAAFVYGEGNHAANAAEAIEASYAADVTDEFVVPVVTCEGGRVQDGDTVIFMNFRPDRARQMTRIFCDDAFTGFERRGGRKQVNYVCMAEYDATMPNCEVAYPPVELKNTLGEYLAAHGKTQLRIAETEKYAHVTFFFNGGVEQPCEGEDRKVIPSPKVATYDLKPEMSAYEVADECKARIESGKYDVIILNFANCDMVGHTGVFDAAVKAVEAVDKCVGEVTDAVLNAGGVVFLTADHGNAEKMKNPDGSPFTAHTTNVVPFAVIGAGDVKLREGGCLADIAPTMLPYIGLPVPAEMTGKSIIVE